jgi:signal transduction histidine kinase
MSPRNTQPPPYVYVIALVGAAIAIVAGQSAIEWYGHPFAGVFLEPDMVVSDVGLPSWDGFRQGLAFPDRIVELDGVDLRGPDRAAHDAEWDEGVNRAVAQRRSTVHVQVESRLGPRSLDLHIEPLGGFAWWVLGGSLQIIAGLYLLSAITALVASPGGALARTFAKAAICSALMLWTFLDLHTSRSLIALNELGMCMVPVAFVGLALRLPDDVAFLARRPSIIRALDGIGLAVALAVHLIGPYSTRVRLGVTFYFAAGMLFFVGATLARFLSAHGARRNMLRGLVGGALVGPTLAATAAILAFLTARGSVATLVFMPALALSPISAAVAYVRHDLWNGDAPISRAALRVVTTAAICLVSVAAAAALTTYLGVPLRSSLAGAAAGGVLATALAAVALDLLDRGVFASRAEYKPTIEQLSEQLTSMTTRDEVAAAIERTVRRWLACERVEFRSTSGVARESSPHESGERAIVEGKALSLDVRFRGATLGVLRVGGKRGGAPFTTDDVDLLQTIANQAALALAHAQAYEELDQRRRQQVAAWREERAAIVETVAAEITHEVRYPINFFRSVFQPGHELDEEEIEIGCEEVTRLERLVAGLRRVTGQRLERHFVPLSALTARAELLLRDTLGGRRLDISVPEGVSIRCDADHVTQVLVNLLANALEASQETDAVGVRWAATNSGGELIVWDRGPGFDADVGQLFAPWFTTKPRGTGLGLAITHRLVRAHAWAIDGARRDGTTLFVVSIPSADVSVAGKTQGSEVA